MNKAGGQRQKFHRPSNSSSERWLEKRATEQRRMQQDIDKKIRRAKQNSDYPGTNQKE